MLSLLFLLATAAPDSLPVRVAVDSARHTVLLTAGPFTIAGADPHAAHHGGGHGHGHADELPVLDFAWPLDGWLRGVALELTDAAGRPLPRRLVHHINVVNFGRRQLFYPAVERTLAMGQETEDITLPKTVGIPVSRGMPMGLILAWHNPDTIAVTGVMVRLRLTWTPTNQVPRPVSVLPAYLDVVDPVASPVDFDLPAGPQRFAADHAMPIRARIVGVSGHVHDYGLDITLDALRGTNPSRVLRVATRRDAGGRVLGVERQLPGVRGRGIKLEAGTTYRVTGRYDNPTGRTIAKGAMVHLVMLVAPERMDDWPAVDPCDARYARDVAWLRGRGK